jgi:putative Ca2+/H+ antiporter (TMEM165/GDT1 family)
MEAFLVSTGIVALAEVADKTQLLALLLAAKFHKPLPIILGIFVATVGNHALAGGLGVSISHLLSPQALKWIVGLSFIGMGFWALIPDKAEEESRMTKDAGIFVATVVAFFLAEMGDKTQVATVALAARFQTFLPVVAGTTLGMLIANVPVVYFGDIVMKKAPVKLIHTVVAIIFFLLGGAAILSALGLFTV